MEEPGSGLLGLGESGWELGNCGAQIPCLGSADAGFTQVVPGAQSREGNLWEGTVPAVYPGRGCGFGCLANADWPRLDVGRLLIGRGGPRLGSGEQGKKSRETPYTERVRSLAAWAWGC